MSKSVVLTTDVTTPEQWVSSVHKPRFLKGRRVRVVEADNMPEETGIVYWIDEPEVNEHPYGIALYKEDFDPQSVRETEDHDLLVCVDCIMYIANGDLPEDRPDFEEECASRWPLASGWHINCGDEEKDEEFSWQDCDCCGSALGGSRHHAIAWKTVK